MQETQVRTLGQEDRLEEEMETHSSILAWKIPWTEEPGCQLSFLIKVETSLALACTVFPLYPGYLGHYGLRFWISFQPISADFL